MTGRLNGQVPLKAAILIGGRSSRMGAPKHLLLRPDGITFLEGAIKALVEISKEIALVGDGEVPDEFVSFPRLSDIAAGRGPLGGILAALQSDPACAWLILPCDMPLVARECLDELIEKRNPARLATVFLPSASPRPLPFPAVYEPAALEPLCAGFPNDGSVLRILGMERLEIISIQDSTPFMDFDTPEELVQLDRLFARNGM